MYVEVRNVKLMDIGKLRNLDRVCALEPTVQKLLLLKNRAFGFDSAFRMKYSFTVEDAERALSRLLK
jgi:hypothetical protein